MPRSCLIPLFSLVAIPCCAWSQPPRDNKQLVGPRDDRVVMTPVNQTLTPAGRQLPLTGMRPQAMSLSPDGQLLVVSGKTSELVVVDPDSGTIRQRVAMPSEEQHVPPSASTNILRPDARAQVSYTGLIFSPDGRRIYLSNVNGSIKVFQVAEDGQVAPSYSLPLPPANAPRRQPEIPSGLALNADGSRLLVAANLSNQLYELDSQTGQLLRHWDVGVAPYDVVNVGDKAFVSNWGGRRPGPGDLTGPAGRGTEVRVDPVRHIASEGSVSVSISRTGETSGDPAPACTPAAWRTAGRPLRRLRQRRQRHLSVIDAETGAAGRHHLGEAQPRGPVRCHAQRRWPSRRPASGSTWPTARRTPSR